MDDKLCTYSGFKAILNLDEDFLSQSRDTAVLALFDNEEIGSGLRQGAKSNFLQTVLQRITEVFTDTSKSTQVAINVLLNPITHILIILQNLFGQMMARSFLLSADVANGLNPGFLDEAIYVPGMVPSLNKGMVVSTDPNGGMTTTSWGMELARQISPDIQSRIRLSS